MIRVLKCSSPCSSLPRVLITSVDTITGIREAAEDVDQRVDMEKEAAG
jgi:hypothetical protein